MNVFPVCDCMLCGPYLRCYFSFCVMVFVCLCVYVMTCNPCLFIELIDLFCVRCHVMFVCFCFWCVYVVCGVLCCGLLFHWFVVRVCVVVVLVSCFAILLWFEFVPCV